MDVIDRYLMAFLDDWRNVVGAAAGAALLVVVFLFRESWLFYLKLIVKSLRRNLLRTTLTALATAVLVLVVTLVWTILWFLDMVTAEKSKDLKVIVTERWQIPSQMPLSYEASLARGAARPGTSDVKPDDHMTWQFYGGTIDPTKRTRENMVFFFGMVPGKLLTVLRDKDGKPLRDQDGKLRYTTMMDGIDELTQAEIELLDEGCRMMEKDRRLVIVGQERLRQLNKRVGEWMTVTSFNYPGVDLEVKIIGAFPKGRYDLSALVNRDYITEGMEAWQRKNGKPHAMKDKSLNLVWLRVPDNDAFRQVAEQIARSPDFTTPAVKAEVASSGIATFFDAYRDLLWGMRWLLVPAVLVTMALVIANAISISVRERRTEMAVLKVLGFGPTQVLVLVLGEAILLGAASGFLSAAGAHLLINKVMGGVPFPIGFFPSIRIPAAALWWGPAVGALTALAGSALPAWSARSVKVAEVFSKIS
jgi:putative ABC transport system permease protein